MNKIKECKRRIVTFIKRPLCLFAKITITTIKFFEIELNLNDLEKLTIEDEIKMYDQDEHAIN